MSTSGNDPEAEHSDAPPSPSPTSAEPDDKEEEEEEGQVTDTVQNLVRKSVHEIEVRRKPIQIPSKDRIELLARPKTDPIDSSTIPRPSYVVPEMNLPSWWCGRSMFDKIPAKSDPFRPTIFSWPQLGYSMYKNFKGKPFDTSTSYDLPLDYKLLHDPNLRRFLYNQRKYFILLKEGLITPYKDKVICSQAEFNRHREYVRKMMVNEFHHQERLQEQEIRRIRTKRQQLMLMQERNRRLDIAKRLLLMRDDQSKAQPLLQALLEGAMHMKGEEEFPDLAFVDLDTDEDLIRIRKEERERRLTRLGERFDENLHRELNFDKRKEEAIKQRKIKASQKWKMMVEEEREKYKKVHQLKDQFEMRKWQNIAQRQNNYDRARTRDRKQLEAIKKKNSAKKSAKKSSKEVQDKDITEAGTKEESKVVRVRVAPYTKKKPQQNLSDSEDPVQTEQEIPSDTEGVEEQPQQQEPQTPSEE